MNPIRLLHELGQSAWLDFLDHQLMASGELKRLIQEDGLRGATSNPTIFQKAIATSTAYDEFVHGASASESDAQLFERICVREVRRACDEFRPVYDDSQGSDGFVSIEVSPQLAGNTGGSLEEARRLWAHVERPNVMVKIPGTLEGLPAISDCLAEGININITLLFSVERYVEVANAYLDALEARASKKQPLDRVASVASFFVSRVDTKVDKALSTISGPQKEQATALRGQAAIANAKLAFGEYERILSGERWKQLEAQGARPQRVLWASTSPKDPAYSDLYYAEALVGPGTIDTMTKETFHAYSDHGRPQALLKLGQERAREQIRGLSTLGLDFAHMMQELEEEGVRAFIGSYRQALETIAKKRGKTSGA